MTARQVLGRVAAPAVVGAAVLATLVVVVAAGGYDLVAAFAALWHGSLGSEYALFSATLVRATPLILLGLSVALAFRAGVLNIGAEGQFLAGASAAVAVGLAIGSTGCPRVVVLVLELLSGVAAGAAWSAIAGILKRRFGVLEVISTLMLNFVAQYGVSYLVRGPLQEPTRVYPQTPSLAPAAHLPTILAGQQLHLGLPIAVAIGAALWWILRSTAVGFRVRAIGDGPNAARVAGRIPVDRVIFWVFLSSGAIAGLAGGIEATGVTYALYEGISPGFGYTAIAVALLARLDPLLVLVSGTFFGALEAGAAAMQRDAGVPSVFVAIIEALVVLGVLAVDRARMVKPGAQTAEDAS